MTDLDRIANAVADEFRVTPGNIKCHSRLPEFTLPRFIFCHVARKTAKNSLETIAWFLNGRDHTTISHALKRAEEMIASDRVLRLRVLALMIHVTEANRIAAVPVFTRHQKTAAPIAAE